MLFSYNYSFVYDPNLTTPYKIIFPKEVYKKIYILLNNKSAEPTLNQFAFVLFYRFASFHNKTISRNKFSLMNPYNDLYDIFNCFSGYLMYVKGEGSFRFNNQNVSPFAWLHPFFYDIVTKTDSIGLDATFRLLKPFKVCISQCIIQNTGVPLGILVADSK
ncbi:hypothetical protein M9Y10_011624 [Tritrichomonas musculus]|uniref:Initiator binding domain-containing protein n=1 Tax=Tritrichomonas musculus TaxID=1915356 RepID=A0ABR2IL23_9EUKA